MLIKKMFNGKKGDAELDTVAWWIIAAIILVLVGVALLYFSGKLSGLGENIKNLFRLRR